MEQQSFIERRKAACKNTWKVIGIDCSKLDEGIEIIKLQNRKNNTLHEIGHVANNMLAIDKLDEIKNLYETNKESMKELLYKY